MVATQTSPAVRSGLAHPDAATAASTEILKSPQDKRLYRRIVLANGLDALLISDPEMAHSLAEDERQDGEEEDEGAANGSDDEVLSTSATLQSQRPGWSRTCCCQAFFTVLPGTLWPVNVPSPQTYCRLQHSCCV